MWVPIWLAILVVIAFLVLGLVAAVAAASVYRSESLVRQQQLRLKALDRADAAHDRAAFWGKR